MDGGSFILLPEADSSLTILINIWYFSLEKHIEQVFFINYTKRKSNWCPTFYFGAIQYGPVLDARISTVRDFIKRSEVDGKND